MTVDKIYLEDDVQMIMEGWLTEPKATTSMKNYINRIIKQGWYDWDDDLIITRLHQDFIKKKKQHPKGLTVFRVSPSEKETYQKWLDVPNWLQDKDIEILERGIRERYLDEEDGITLQVLDWAWQEEVNWEDAPFKKRTHNIINTLEVDELITDYIRNLKEWTSYVPKKERLTQIHIGDLINLNNKEEILDFRHKLCFIRDYQVYNAKWKDILNAFDKWFREEYHNRYGCKYKTHPPEHETLSDMFWDKVYIQQKGWGNLKELKKECW